MIFNMMIGGGSTKIKIKTVTSVEDLPEAGKLGEVYLITEQETGTSWFQPTEPVGEFAIGDVWVKTNDDSPYTINLADEGSIIVGLSEAFVWDGTEWAETEFRVWKPDEGWSVDGNLIVAGSAKAAFVASGTTVTQDEGYINLKASSGASGYYRTEELIDLTGYTTISLKAKNLSDPEVQLAVWAADDTRTKLATVGTTVSVVTGDVTSLTDQYYVGVFGKNANSGQDPYKADVYELTLS